MILVPMPHLPRHLACATRMRGCRPRSLAMLRNARKISSPWLSPPQLGFSPLASLVQTKICFSYGTKSCFIGCPFVCPNGKHRDMSLNVSITENNDRIPADVQPSQKTQKIRLGHGHTPGGGLPSTAPDVHENRAPQARYHGIGIIFNDDRVFVQIIAAPQGLVRNGRDIPR